MESPPLEIQWSPAHDDKFIIWGSEINVYEARKPAAGEEEVEPVNRNEIVEEWWSRVPENRRIRCVEIHPTIKTDILVAVGQPNGKIAFSTFGDSPFWSLGLETKELSLEHERPCNALAWNPINTHQIASGVDAYPDDHSIIIWDVFNTPYGSVTLKPIAKFEQSTTYSLSWFKDIPECIVAGIKRKSLRVYDMRSSESNVLKTSTNCVYGVAVSPHNNSHIVSHFSNKINIWDTRYFDQPLLTIKHDSSSSFSKVLWSPTKSNLVGAIDGKRPLIKLYDIHHSDEYIHHRTEPDASERNLPTSITVPKSFSWHPTELNRFLAISTRRIIDHVLANKIPIGWSAKSRLTWGDAPNRLRHLKNGDKFYETLGDITILTKKRAAAEYGILSDFSVNGEISEDEVLRKLWRWLRFSQLAYEEGPELSENMKFLGVKTVLKLDGVTNYKFVQSRFVKKIWSDATSNDHSAIIYRSKDRDRALTLCGWSCNEEESTDESKKTEGIFNLDDFLTSLEAEKSYSRAIAISIFNLNLKQAIEISYRGAGDMEIDGLTLSLALAGFSERSLWKETCSRTTLSDPYLNAVFSFLSAKNDAYGYILYNNRIQLEDKVAFALIYLSDDRLKVYFKFLKYLMLSEGNLGGFFLSGPSQEGIKLLEKYLELSGDAQSSTLIALTCAPSEQIFEEPIQSWIASYRLLLDSWKMWANRARFDMFMRRISGTKPPKQLFISCSFCEKNLSGHYLKELLIKPDTTYAAHSELESLRLNNFSCPHCLKPLPRCAVCLMGMELSNQVSAFSKFDKSFSWCLTCKHGGHIGHLMSWFQKNSKCPVVNCSCKCMAVDNL